MPRPELFLACVLLQVLARMPCADGAAAVSPAQEPGAADPAQNTSSNPEGPFSIDTIITFVIAAVGGGPGLLTIIGFLRNRNRIHWKLEHTIRGEGITRDGQRDYILLLSGFVTNRGSKPIYPIKYEANCRLGKRWLKLQRRLIPRETAFLGAIHDIELNEPWRQDLQVDTNQLAHGEPRFGHLLFKVPKEVAQDLASAAPTSLMLVCEDSLGKKHRVRFTAPKGDIADMVFPHTGVAVKTRQSSALDAPPASPGTGA